MVEESGSNNYLGDKISLARCLDALRVGVGDSVGDSSMNGVDRIISSMSDNPYSQPQPLPTNWNDEFQDMLHYFEPESFVFKFRAKKRQTDMDEEKLFFTVFCDDLKLKHTRFGLLKKEIYDFFESPGPLNELQHVYRFMVDFKSYIMTSGKSYEECQALYEEYKKRL